MKKTEFIMGMPVTIEIIGCSNNKIFNKVFDYFRAIDEKFSTYKKNSEISLINLGSIKPSKYSPDMKKIFRLAAKTKKETNGYFDIVRKDKKIDPSGIVKGWAIWEAAKIIKRLRFSNFYVDVGADIEAHGTSSKGKKWRVGIRNPFKPAEIIRVIEVSDKGVATSGNYERGEHIYNPKSGSPANEISSITVIGPNIYEADRFATAAFAMGLDGINFIERQKNLQGYMIDKKGIATLTSGFDRFIIN